VWYLKHFPHTDYVPHNKRCQPRSQFLYDFPSGQLTLSKDENGNSTTYHYDDAFARLTSSTYPDNGQATIAYSDAGPNPTITTSHLSQAGVSLTDVAVMDALGHSRQSQLTSDATDGADYTDLTYDGLGRIWTRSNPHRSGASSTDGTTTFYYDALGRTCLVVPPDGTLPAGSTCPTTRPTGDVFTTYSGNCATVTDEAGKSRNSCSDAFGRVTQVVEDPGVLNYQTNYSYDALNNLTCAVQKATDT